MYHPKRRRVYGSVPGSVPPVRCRRTAETPYTPPRAANAVPSKRLGLPRPRPGPLPVLRVARLASAKEARGRGVGRLLLRSELDLALAMATGIGCVGVVVDAKDGAVSFYERYGFEAFGVVQGGSPARPMPTPMFLPLGRVPRA